ncbi:MAG TPA: histidine kinase dimerization/phospho-acceptor domain-containing protein, partial [Rhodanobacteraceae bacterium]
MASDSHFWSERPSRAVSLAVSAALVALWAWIRLIAFDTTLFPLTYALPLFVCVWTRDRLALWGMAVIFIAMQSVRIFVLEPPGTYTTHGLTANTIGTVLSIGIAAMAIQAIIHLRERLEAALANVNAQAAELRSQGDALAQQNAALERQTQALSAQGDELGRQNVALQSQSTEIAGLNSVLERRERLLETLLETARVSGTEVAALQHIANAAVELFPDLNVIAAVYEETDEGLALRALAPSTPDTPLPDPRSTANPSFVRLMMREQRTAALNDSRRRSDLEMPFFLGQPPMRAILAAAIRSGDAVFGACAICLPHPHEWTDVEFRVTEWLADQCGRVLQALRVQSDLREADRQKNEFLATLSHELRNPLAPIRFALEVMAHGADRGDAVKVINRQFQHLARLVDDLLDATRLSRNMIQVRKTRVDLVPILRSAIEAIRPDVESASHT